MKSPLVLLALLSLVVAEVCHAYCLGSQEQQMPGGLQTKKNSDLYKPSPSLLRRLYDGQGINYETLLRLMGKEEITKKNFVGTVLPYTATLAKLTDSVKRKPIGPQALTSSQKRDMHDFFVGLMGKRTMGLDDSTEGNKGALPSFGDLQNSSNVE